MKIIKIKFENIHNLKGEQEVDFSAAPLHAAGLFAITGPTGSGKSTLLDVITLALFNRMPRFSKAISSGEISKLGSILTHHTKSAKASIEYEARDKRYRSTWSIEHTRTGNLKNYHMELQDNDGNILDLKRSEVPAMNEAIIGLKYDQFVKSIILAQGEFSKFLKADKNERGQLLENITGTTIYRRIGQLAYDRYSEVKADVDQQKALLESISILTDDERTQIQSDINDATAKKVTLNKSIERLDAAVKIKQEITSTSHALETKSRSKTKLLEDIKAFEPLQEKLALQEKINPLLGDIRIHENAKKEATSHQQTIVNLEQASTKAKESLSKVIDTMSTLTKQSVTPDNFREIMSAFEKEIVQLDHQLNTLRSKGLEQRQRINNQLTGTTLGLTSKIKPLDALTTLDRKRQTTQQVITNSQIDSSVPLADLKQAIKQDRGTFDQLKELHHAVQHIHETTQQVKHEQEKLIGYKKNLSTAQQLLDKTKTIAEQQKEKLQLLRKQKEDALTIAALEEHRAKLTDGDPCPLCGSTNHPYSIHTPESAFDAIDQQIESVQQRSIKTTNELNSLIGRISGEKASIQHTGTDIEKLEKIHTEWQQKKSTILDSISTDISADEKTLASRIHTLQKKIQLTEAGIEAIEQQKIISSLITEYTTLKETLGTHQTVHKLRHEKTTVKDISRMCNDLQDDFIKWQTAVQTHTHDLTKTTSLLEQAQTTSSRIEQKLLPTLSTLGITSVAATSSYILDEETRQKIKSQQEDFVRQRTALDTEINNLKAQVKLLTDQDKNSDTDETELVKTLTENRSARDKELTQIGERNQQLKQDNEAQKKLASKSKALEKTIKQAEKWELMKKLIGDKSGNTFANFAQGLTLQRLLAFTNKRLVDLSDRYLLAKPKDDGALQVIDQYQGQIHRSVTTLSGGETFLLSLALALSLSDMASNNVPLDSLFIDEGFGTLDQETLDMAMDTLERLQSENQKTIGVISHVEALKERIQVQIRLEKNAQGYSRVNICD